MIKRKRNRSYIIIGSLLILLGILIPLSKYIYNIHLDIKEEEKIEDFFNEPVITEETSSTEETTSTSENVSYTYNYIGVLEIPTISLKRGLVAINDYNNNVDRNIQILKDSDMPDVVNGTFMLASHSGNGYYAFFNKLNKVNNGDEVYVYYNNIKYIYKIVNSYTEVKDGDITIHRNNNKTTIVLTTCSREQKGYQLILIGELVDKKTY